MIMARSVVKQALAFADRRREATGMTALIYHRVGGATDDELDLSVAHLEGQLDEIVDGGHAVVSLDEALDRLDAGDNSPTVVLTFDDGFSDVHDHAWPLLRERRLPFTVYLAAGLVGREMRWEGSTASSQGAQSLTWDQLADMHASGLCTVGNHTWDHAGPGTVRLDHLDRCSDEIARHLGERPRHFAWTWGVPVETMLPPVRERFRSAATGIPGRNEPDGDRHALHRVPVRRTDPLSFFRAKLRGDLRAERAYGRLARAAKAVRMVDPRG